MKLYEIEIGATYWAAAENIQNAIDALWACCDQLGELEDALAGEYLHIEEVRPARAATLRFREDDEKNAGRLMIDVAKECEQPEIIACSEWP